MGMKPQLADKDLEADRGISAWMVGRQHWWAAASEWGKRL